MSTIKRPVQIEEFKVALQDIADGELQTIKKELIHSVEKLVKTNNKLKKLTSDEEETPKSDNKEAQESDDDEEYYDVSKEDEALFHEIIFENEVVLKNQAQRISAVEDELSFRGIKFDKFTV